ncbi:MAG: hypothetical protein GWN00_19805 [Aliifodinibius sp.]|nr:hypothetical protein [Fodinibius sp.]NIY26968.1 hypothetical protein [Fodinibius sp.]
MTDKQRSKLDITNFSNVQTTKKHVDRKALSAVSDNSGFPNREPKRPRRRKRSPYTEVKAFKVRPALIPIIHELAERMDCYDNLMFEKALESLITKEGFHDLSEKFTGATKK